MTPKRFLLLCLLFALLAACQSQSEKNRSLAQKAGLPDAGWRYLETNVLSERNFALESVQPATNLAPFLTSERYANYFSGVQEIWCADLEGEDKLHVFLALNRKDTKWGALLFLEPEEQEENAEIGHAAGCTNWRYEPAAQESQ